MKLKEKNLVQYMFHSFALKNLFLKNKQGLVIQDCNILYNVLS
jgi:hypothetical protein